ncbi:unnamed protein product [Acidithrix sp. C25]|nr:unnamed protein product [Acidithrix sp. C25]
MKAPERPHGGKMDPTEIIKIVTAAEKYTESQSVKPHVDVHPAMKLTIVSCMDSRLDLFGILGLDIGDAHIVRNAGGIVTDDVIRSLAVSQRSLGTNMIVLIHHTDCGLEKISDDDFKFQIEREIGIRPSWAVEAFRDPYDDVRQSIARLAASPFVTHKQNIFGFVYEVDKHQLVRVDPYPS